MTQNNFCNTHNHSRSWSPFVRNGARLAQVILALALLNLAVPNALAGANQKTRTYTFTVENDNDTTAKGFYLAVPGIQASQVDTVKSGGKTLTGVRVNPPPGGGSGVTVFFENPNNGIAAGAKETITLRLTGLTGADPKFGKYGYRDKGDSTGRPLDGGAFGPTFKLVGDPLYSLLNNDEVPQTYEVHDLQFLVNTSELTDPSIALDFGNSYGFGPSQPTFFLQSTDSESLSYNLPSVDDGNWLYARGRLFQNGVEVSDFVQGALYDVPEPSSLLWLCGGICLLARPKSKRKT